MDKSVDTFEQIKRFLSAFFPSWKNIFFVDSQPPLSPFSMLKYAPWTLSRDYNIEKGRGGRNVKAGDWKTHALNKTGFFRAGSVSTTFVHDCRLEIQKRTFSRLGVRLWLTGLLKKTFKKVLCQLHDLGKKMMIMLKSLW